MTRTVEDIDTKKTRELYVVFREVVRRALQKQLPYFLKLPGNDRWYDLPESERLALVDAVRKEQEPNGR